MISRIVLVALLTLLVIEAVLQLATGPLFPSGATHYKPWMAFDPVFACSFPRYSS